MALAGLSLLCLPIFWSILFRALGTAIGVGLGLGLAAHVHDVLDRWKDGADDDKYGSRGKQGQRGGGFDASPKSSPIQQPRPSPGLLPALARGGTAEHLEDTIVDHEVRRCTQRRVHQVEFRVVQCINAEHPGAPSR